MMIASLVKSLIDSWAVFSLSPWSVSKKADIDWFNLFVWR
jgi:hypothetical protein